jgi:protein-S-isoprenylcysteine O-methyltransferase Ste14
MAQASIGAKVVCVASFFTALAVLLACLIFYGLGFLINVQPAADIFYTATTPMLCLFLLMSWIIAENEETATQNPETKNEILIAGLVGDFLLIGFGSMLLGMGKYNYLPQTAMIDWPIRLTFASSTYYIGLVSFWCGTMLAICAFATFWINSLKIRNRNEDINE